MRLKLTCTRCGVELRNELDTFGDVGDELCEDCWYEYYDEVDGSYYGLAPHHHDLSITGSFIGSTIFDPLPEPAPDGRYWIADRGMWFRPDDEVGGSAGVWERK